MISPESCAAIIYRDAARAEEAAAALRETLRAALEQLAHLSPEELVEQRYAKFRAMGNFFL